MIDINWINNFGPNGYGICGRRYVQILDKLGFRVKITPVPYMDPNDRLSMLINRKVKNPVDIYHAIATVPQNCYYTVVEVRKPLDYMAYALQQSEFIMTQSEFCKESFSQVTEKEKIHVVNFPFPNIYSPKGPQYTLRIPEQYKFKFLTVARVDVRKNLTLLMKAFADEFGDNPEVCLILKMGSDRYCIPKMFYDLDLPKNIFWMRDFVEDTSALYRSMDAYITTDNGEGWGAPTTEAMLCGLPTIAPRHSGHLEYMNDDNSFLIDVGDWEFIGYDNMHPERVENLYPDLLAPILEWKVPNYDHTRKLMRKCYEMFKDMPKEERIETEMIKNSLKVKKIVSEKYVGEQLMKAFEWYENAYR